MDPYRTSDSTAPEKLDLYPDASRRTLSILAAAGLLGAVIMVISSSATVEIQCRRAGQSVSCTTTESTFLSSTRHETEPTGLQGFALRTSGSGKSRREWMVAVANGLDTGITGTPVPTKRREAALEQLNSFAKNAQQTSVQAEFGSRWSGLNFLPLFAIGAVFLYVILGTRHRVTVDRRSRQAWIESRLWPLPPRTTTFELARFDHFTTESRSKGNTRIVLVLLDGTRFPLTNSYTSARKEDTIFKMESFLRGE